MATSRKAPGRRSAQNRTKKRRGTPMEGTRLELDVENVAHGGHCVARHEGRVVFVRHALPGERVVARVTDGTSESSFLRADAFEILEASPDRVTPPCRFAGPGGCGGCDWQHVSLAGQRRLKADVVREQLGRIAKLDVAARFPTFDVEALPGDGPIADGLRWRTRLELGVHRGVPGLRAHRSHRLIEVDDCLIADEGFAPAYDERFEPGVTGFDLVRPSVGDIVGIELPQPKGEATPSVLEVVASAHGDTEFEVSARGFWQVHPAAAATFVDVVLDALRPEPGECALDLYCGVGLFTRALSDLVGESGHVVGIEANAEAIDYARRNVDGARHVDLYAADVASLELADLTRGEPSRGEPSGGRLSRGEGARDARAAGCDFVVLDPPRAGAGRPVVEQVAGLRPRAIAYVACDPAALARDVAYFAEHGYVVDELRAFDAFPMTQHVECIATLHRSSSAQRPDRDGASA